jgi:hypothetical protein
MLTALGIYIEIEAAEDRTWIAGVPSWRSDH